MNKRHGRSRIVLSLLLTVSSAWLARADDWHRWRGPDLTGISKETGWFKPWPKEGPKQVWKANVEAGFSTVSVAEGRVFTTGSKDKRETVWCLDEKSGSVLWKHTYPTAFKPEYYEGGSSGTPTIDRDRVYHLGQMGELFCFEAGTGKVAWSNNIAQATGTKIPTWGLTGSPLVHGGLLLLNVGGTGAAVEKASGKIVWKSDGEGGYATPVPFTGHDEVLIMSTKDLAGINPKDGKVAWRYPWPTRYDVNAADPVLAGDNRIFISSGYEHGGALVQVKDHSATKLWENKNMRNHFNASVLLDGFLYGIDGDAGNRSTSLRCVDLATGTAKWKETAVGSGALTAADGKLIIISDKGELIIAEASSAAFKPLARAQVLGGKCWTVPVLANGKIYARNSKGDLVCVDPSGK